MIDNLKSVFDNVQAGLATSVKGVKTFAETNLTTKNGRWKKLLIIGLCVVAVLYLIGKFKSDDGGE